MGIFDGYLLCSDWDGTIHTRGEGFHKDDLQAISYFVNNGGEFTICSGRYLPYLENFFDCVRPSTYVITLNGAIIVHPDTREVLYEGFIDGDTLPVIDELFEFDFYSLMIYFEGAQCGEVFSKEEYLNAKVAIRSRRIYKCVLIGRNSETVINARASIDTNKLKGHALVRSWPEGLELINLDNEKGAAVKRLKSKLGAHTLITVGDYENDISMLQTADIGYAMGDAIETVKSVADRITLPSMQGAIAKIIQDLEEEIRNSATN